MVVFCFLGSTIDPPPKRMFPFWCLLGSNMGPQIWMVFRLLPCKPTPRVPSKQNTHKQPLVCRLTQADQRWRKMEDPESGEEANSHVAVQEAKVFDLHLVNNILFIFPCWKYVISFFPGDLSKWRFTNACVPFRGFPFHLFRVRQKDNPIILSVPLF